ncbi:hypothetical protein [Bradyrhizobium niftali]|jgi:hypothetical protein|nr:hypothetical protein [Bradyrhizobium niftali]
MDFRMDRLAFLLWRFSWGLGGAMQMAIQLASHNTILVSSRPGGHAGA